MNKDGPKLAIALKYDQDKVMAPQVVATGRGERAQKIIEKAEDAGVAVMENPQLARALVSIEVGEVIPVELYGVVAEILAFVYQMDSKSKIS